MTRENAARSRAIIGVGLCLGTAFGGLYFVLEPLRDLSGRYGLLGVPLASVLAVYLVFGSGVGLCIGAVFAVVSAKLRRPSSDRIAVAVAGVLALLLIVFVQLRHYYWGGLRSVTTSPDIIVLAAAAIVVVAAGHFGARYAERWRLLRRIGKVLGASLVAVCLLAVAAAWAIGRSQENRLPDRRDAGGPNVVHIVLDALRADHLGAYGYHRDTSPNIDRLAREGVTFLNAHSHGNRTIIAMPSMFTSLYPSFHGAVGRRDVMRPLPASRTTVAEVLRDAGYVTVGIMTNVYLKGIFGMTQGFDKREEFHAARYNLGLYKGLRKLGLLAPPTYFRSTHPIADEVTDNALRWLDRVKGRPFYLFVHYMDTHHPYVPPPPFDSHFGDARDAEDAMALFGKTAQLVKNPPPLSLPDDELARLQDYYDGTIRFADREIGRLIDAIRHLPADRETIVIVTSDHGDEFLEHGSLYHNNLLIEELIHVPMVLWSSQGRFGQTQVEPLVRHVDILPTLAELCGASVPSEAMGASLLPLLNGETETYDVTSVAEGDFCTAISYLNWKIMKVDSTETVVLYDLDERPCETRDLSKSHPEIMEMMSKHLRGYLDQADQAAESIEDAVVDSESIRVLRALGYL